MELGEWYDESELDDFSMYDDPDTVQLRDWQRKAKKFFFESDCNCIFEVATGCLVGSTLIDMPRDISIYPYGIPIKTLVGKKNFYTYSYNTKYDKLELKKVKNVWKSGVNKDIYEIETLSGRKIRATKNHPFLVDIREKPEKGCGRGKREKIVNRVYKKLKDLTVGDYLSMWPRNHKKCNGGYSQIKKKIKERIMPEHRFIMQEIFGNIGRLFVHHKDENKLNNNIENLEIINPSEHSSMHTKKRGFYGKELWINNEHPRGMLGKTMVECKNKKKHIVDIYSDEWRKMCSEWSKKGLSKLTREKLSKRSSYGGKTHYSDRIKNIKYVGKEDVYDMEVEDNHNFLANDFIVHNSGKTFAAIDIMQEVLDKEPDTRVLIIVPKNVILETGWYKELTDAGLPIQDIGVYYGDVKEFAQITVTNMQSISRIPLDIFDMCIMDEVHNFGTRRMLEYIKHPFKYRLGLSATLKRMDYKHYDIMKIFNYNVFEYKPAQALNDGVLNPFEFRNIGVRLDGEAQLLYDDLSAQLNAIFKAGGNYNAIMRTSTNLKYKMLSVLNSRKSLVNNYHEKFDIARQIILKHKNDKIIVFNQFNEQTSKMYWHLLEDDIECRVVHSGIDKQKREQALMDFKNDRFNVLLTSKVLDEGYNLPKLDVAIIMAGDSTDKQTVQRMGRVLRKKKGKNSMLYQIFCVDTMEARNAEERAKIFKSLSSDYRDITYDKFSTLDI